MCYLRLEPACLVCPSAWNFANNYALILARNVSQAAVLLLVSRCCLQVANNIMFTYLFVLSVLFQYSFVSYESFPVYLHFCTFLSCLKICLHVAGKVTYFYACVQVILYWKLNDLSAPLREVLQTTLCEMLQGILCSLRDSVLFQEVFLQVATNIMFTLYV